MRPCSEVRFGSARFVIAEPTSTLMVYGLGVLIMALGVQLLRTRSGQESRGWWGVCLLLWGLGTLAAGTSYQAFSYEIKCAGRELCLWTSWWEVSYMLLTVGSMNAMVVAVGAGAVGKAGRKRLATYALANLGVYSLAAIYGAFTANQFLISFELMVLFSSPNVLICFVINARRYFRQKTGLDLALLVAWLSLGGIIAAYFGYFLAGVTERLWEQGVWFSANDVLHLLLIGWMIYLGLVVAPKVRDSAQ